MYTSDDFDYVARVVHIYVCMLVCVCVQVQRIGAAVGARDPAHLSLISAVVHLSEQAANLLGIMTSDEDGTLDIIQPKPCQSPYIRKCSKKCASPTNNLFSKHFLDCNLEVYNPYQKLVFIIFIVNYSSNITSLILTEKK